MEEPRRLGGRYELGQVLGRGGMAEVYLAHDTRLGRTVAVKTLRTDLARDPTFQARFRREAQSAASLNHPAIVAVYDTGEDYVEGVSIPYIVMEYVNGSTLRELLHSGRKLLPERALEMCIGILQALEYSHRNGIVHRDIKPANVMLTRDGQVKVMDFGIARAMGDAGVTMTQTAAVIGTAQYLSPEQAKGETVDARSDLYSTGCLIYELLTVRPPFVGDSPVAVAYQHVREDPQPPSVFDQEITPDTDAIVLKALAKDPEYRYQTADEMRGDIEAALDGRPVGAAAMMGAVPYGYDDHPTQALTPQHGGPTTTAMPPGNGAGPPERRDRRQQKNRTSTVLLVLAGVLVLVGAVFVGRALFGGDPPTDKTVPEVLGETFEEAQARADRVDLEVRDAGVMPCEDYAEGTVCAADPAPGEAVEAGTVIELTMSEGPPAEAVPDVVDQDVDTATDTLEEAGFEVDQESEESDREPGTVLAQSPDAGTEQEAGSTVTLTVASEPDTVEVPDVVGQQLADAQNMLQNQGFQVTAEPQRDELRAENEVISQNPRAGQGFAPGETTVHLVFAQPEEEDDDEDDPEEVQIPGDLEGKPLGEVRQQLEGLGLGVSVNGPEDDNATVMRSDPAPNETVPEGSDVVLHTLPENGDGGPPGDDGGWFGGGIAD